MLANDTINNPPLSRYLMHSHEAHLQWVTEMAKLSDWILVHLQTVEGRALTSLAEAWLIWGALQPDIEKLVASRPLPLKSKALTRPVATSATLPTGCTVHMLADQAREPVDVMSAERRAQQLLAVVAVEAPATVDALLYFFFEYNQCEAAGVSDDELAIAVAGLHQAPHPNVAPMHNLRALITRYCFQCNMLTNGPPISKNGKLYFVRTIAGCPFAPSSQKLAKMDRSSWDSRCFGDGNSNMAAHKVLVGATKSTSYVVWPGAASSSSPAAAGPYVRLGINNRGLGLHVIQVPDTSTTSLEQIQRLTATVRAEEKELELGRLSRQLEQLTQAGNVVPVAPMFHSSQLGGQQPYQPAMSTAGLHTLGGTNNYRPSASFDLRGLNSLREQWEGRAAAARISQDSMMSRSPAYLEPLADSIPVGCFYVGTTLDNKPLWLSEVDVARLHTAQSVLGPEPSTWDQASRNVQPAVLSGSAP